MGRSPASSSAGRLGSLDGASPVQGPLRRSVFAIGCARGLQNRLNRLLRGLANAGDRLGPGGIEAAGARPQPEDQHQAQQKREPDPTPL
jgi:hypothetical protein